MLTPFKPRVRALGAVAVLALLLAGCSPILDEAENAATASPSVAPPSSAPAKTPREKLTGSVPTYRTPSYSWSMVNEGVRDGWTASKGVVDPPGKTFLLENVVRDAASGVSTIWHIRVVHPKTWVWIELDNPRNEDGFPEFPTKWGLLEQEQVEDSGPALGWDLWSKDPANVGLLFREIVDAKEAGPGVFTGTINIQKAKLAEVVDEKTLTALGAKAKAVPFRALLDPQGRILDLVLKVPGTAKTKPITHWIAYRDYGAATVTKPPTAAETAPTTDDVYELINS
ncbi:hypothetical protein [Cryptosporangium sp. NPDC048952]|uniref:hypothetical protein n=1 Tax=Cryptosporangium sp. NPDC048952 TaxID=3363961 RepID=UPI003716D231